MIRRWIYGAAALLTLLNAACRSTEEKDGQDSDSTVVKTDSHSGHNHAVQPEGGSSFTCPMHPQIVQSQPGSCPICAMDLVPVVKTGSKATEVMLSASQRQLANIRVRPVTSGTIGNTTVLNARLVADQQRTNVISSRIAGRLERLYIKEIGQPVRKGQLLYELYSESLLTYQQEYLVALKQEQELGKAEARYGQFLQAAQQRLKLYGMTDALIRQLAQRGTVQPRIPFLAPASGTVTEIAASEGQYVGEGSLLYRLVDLSHLWVEADLYAGEADWLTVGSRVQVQIAGYESEPLTARVSFINPEYKAGSQILTVRAELINPAGRFQPGMQARLLAQHGRQQSITLPVDAVIRDQRGTHVYVQTTDSTFQPRRVETGLETADQVAITGGLKGDENVVVSGAYLLYSEIILKKGVNPLVAITAENKTEQVSPRRQDASVEPPNLSTSAPQAFQHQLTALYEQSLRLTESLIASDPAKARAEAAAARKTLEAINRKQLPGSAHQDWMKQLSRMQTALSSLAATADLEKQRSAYAQFSDGLYHSIKMFGIEDKPVFRQFCPMAQNNQGGYWLSDKKAIRNPYFGEQMLTCGETKEEIR
ncbi:efflux RND transporter periplasmic adaptor subunit [Larkinella insperata]|uniref:Efflux RND transporter periplasmic adaptor subunit n=1 Tax=Larkinella insperata TaxID=332158 RepID=A0ABW3Q6Q5_9BACT